MKKSVLASLAIFLAAAAVFSSLYFQMPNLRDYDSYFHTKMGQLVMERGVLYQFPWTQFTFLKDHYVDPYLLFHVYLGLWIKLFPAGPLVAVKLAMSVLLGLVAVAYFRVVKTFNARWAWLGLALLPAMLSSLTYQRLTYVRPHVVSILILLLGVGAILRRNWWVLALLSFLYVYIYSAPHLLPVVAFLASVVFSAKEKRLAWEPFLFSLGGMVAGLVVNPYFPRDFGYLYTVTFKMAARQISSTSITPAELSPLSGLQILVFNLTSLSMLFLSILAVFVVGRKLSARSLFLFLTAGFFLVLLLRSARFIEYWPFIGSLCVCSILSETTVDSPAFGKVMKKPIAALCAAVFLAVGALQVRTFHAHAMTFVPFEALKDVMDVLDKDADPGDIVYTKDWAFTQPMFYLSEKVYYLVMFDPEIMRMTHPGLYDLWYIINAGSIRTGALPLVRSIEAATKDPEIQRLRTALESGEVMDRLPDIIKSAFKAKWIIGSHRTPDERDAFRLLMSEFPVDISFVKGNEYFSLYRLR
jgi:hypothetical protein